MKTKLNRLIPIILLVVIIGITVAACGSSSSIVGRWQPITGEEGYMEFFSDGRIELEDPTMTLTGTYELDGDQVGISIDGLFPEDGGEPAVAIATYIIDRDILTLIQGDNIAKFIRVD